MNKIKHLIADWKTHAMISNRISTLNKVFFTLLSKIQAEKYRHKQDTSIVTVKTRKEHRTMGDRQYNDGKQRECDFSLIYQRCPLEDWDQTLVLYAAMSMSPLPPMQVSSPFLYWYLLTLQSWFPLCLHECLADLVRCQNKEFHSEVL